MFTIFKLLQYKESMFEHIVYFVLDALWQDNASWKCNPLRIISVVLQFYPPVSKCISWGIPEK